MSSKKKAYIHLDFETTTLQAFKGHARSYGMVITDHELRAYGTASDEEWVHPNLWHPRTLDWAAKTYGPEFIQESMDKGLKDWRHIWAHLTDQFNENIKQFQRVFGEHELWLVCNHTDFDFTILKVMYEMLTRECPIKYNHSLDMQSLMVGHDSGFSRGCQVTKNGLSIYADPRVDVSVDRRPTEDVYKLRSLYDKRGGKENVTHNALEDAMAQVEMLLAQGVRLPE